MAEAQKTVEVNLLGRTYRVACDDGEREALLRARPEVTITSFANAPPPAHFIPGELIQRHTPRLLDGAERLCRILEAARTAR